LETLIRGLRVI